MILIRKREPVVNPSSLIIAALALAGSGICAYYAHPAARWKWPRPGLVATPSARELGTIKQGLYNTSFDLTNQDSRRIDILHVVQSCSCTNVKIAATPVAPRECRRLTCTWDARSKRGRAKASLQLVYRVDGEEATRSTFLSLCANVVPDFFYSPPRLTFFEGAKSTKHVSLSAAGPTKISVVGASCTQRAFRAHVRGLRIAVTFEPTRWAGDRTFVDLVIRTTSPNEPTCRIPIVVVKGRG